MRHGRRGIRKAEGEFARTTEEIFILTIKHKAYTGRLVCWVGRTGAESTYQYSMMVIPGIHCNASCIFYCGRLLGRYERIRTQLYIYI